MGGRVGERAGTATIRLCKALGRPGDQQAKGDQPEIDRRLDLMWRAITGIGGEDVDLGRRVAHGHGQQRGRGDQHYDLTIAHPDAPPEGGV